MTLHSIARSENVQKARMCAQSYLRLEILKLKGVRNEVELVSLVLQYFNKNCTSLLHVG